MRLGICVAITAEPVDFDNGALRGKAGACGQHRNPPGNVIVDMFGNVSAVIADFKHRGFGMVRTAARGPGVQ